MKPVARRSGLVVRPAGSDLVTLAPDHVVHRLGPVAAWVYAHADGTRDVDALLVGLRAAVDGDADKALVFEALDRLADAGLLEERVAPPASLSRRGLITRLAGASALAALTAVVGMPLDALAAGPACGDDKDLIDEIAFLEAESKAVASILEDWVMAEPEGDDAAPDEFYLAELGAREDKYKATEQREKESLDDAEYDLAACKSLKKKEKLAPREQDAKAHFKKRADEKSKKTSVRHEHIAERRIKVATQEEKKKKQVQEKLEKVGPGAEAKKKKFDDQLKRSSEERVKKEAFLERKDEETQKHYSANMAHIESKQEATTKNIDAKLVSSEERAKKQADFYSSKAQEEASKDAGVTDRALEIAQEESNKAVIVGAEKRKEYEAAQEELKKKSQEQNQKDYAQEEKQKSDAKAQEEKQKLDLKAQEEKEKSSATEQNQKLDLKAQEELEKSSAAEQKKKQSASAEQEAKFSELKKEQDAKFQQAEQAKKAAF